MQLLVLDKNLVQKLFVSPSFYVIALFDWYLPRWRRSEQSCVSFHLLLSTSLVSLLSPK